MKLLLTITATLMVTIVPLPNSLALYRPDILLVLVLYIQCCMPVYFHLTWVFLLGIYLDVLCATTIGQHSLALIITTWAAAMRSDNFRYFSTLQQMSIVLLFILLHHFITCLIEIFLGLNAYLMPMFGPAFISLLFWPCLKFLFAKPLET